MNHYSIKNRIWIEGKYGAFLAEGRVNLLKQIIRYGSINKAAKEMKMSYRKAWELVNSMNENSNKPLVVKISGGVGGGGTEVTQHGKKAIELFEKINDNCKAYLENEMSKFEL